jgi:hypothetical protein
MTEKQWPSSLQTRTADEWTALGADWSNPESRTIVMDTMKALGVPAAEYVRKQPPQRVELIIELQEKMKPGSTKGGGAKETKAASTTKAAATTTKKAAATTKPANTGSTSAGEAGGTAATVDLGPVLEELASTKSELAAVREQLASMEKRDKQIFAALRILVLSNPEAAALVDDADTVRELAEGNLSSAFDEGNEG